MVHLTLLDIIQIYTRVLNYLDRMGIKFDWSFIIKPLTLHCENFKLFDGRLHVFQIENTSSILFFKFE